MDINKDTLGRERAYLTSASSHQEKNRMRGIRRIVARVSLLHVCVVILLLTMLFGSACHLIFPFDLEPASPNYRCTIKQIPCTYKKKTASVTVINPAGLICKPEPYLVPGDPVYCGINLSKLTNAGPCSTFKRSTVIKLPFSDRLDTSSDYLKIRLLEDVEGFYLAYDSRVTTKPKWLQDLFDISTCAADFVTITNPKMSNPPSPACNQPLKMQVYKWKTSPLTKNTVITVPGNACDYQNVPGNLPSACLRMYIPFIIPKFNVADLVNCNPSNHKLFRGKTCDPNEQIARQDLVPDCDANLVEKGLYNWKCDASTIDCCDVGNCSESQAHGLTMLSYTVSSVVKFVPAQSIATFTLQGETPDKKPVSGDIHFEYRYNRVCDCMKDMRVNDMHIEVPNMSVKGITFTDMTVTLNKSGWANCDNWTTQFGRNPCLSYTIPASQFSCNFNFKQDGDQHLIVVDNRHGPAQVKINNTTRQLEVKGIKLTTKVDIDGDMRDLTIDLDLFGNFENFAPHASGDESQVESECEELTNKETIHLTASTSFDPQNTLPSPPTLTYEWYEDYGLPTQKSLGKGVNCYILPGTMKFGVHKITLVVRDSFGVAGTDKFDVTVKDTKPPSIKAPKGFLASPSPSGGGVKLNLGQPTVYDDCQSGDVWVSNDAPEWFFPGLHTITWTADDGSGNTSQDVQNISVMGAVMVDGADIGLALPPGGFGPHPAPGDFTITAGGADIWDATDQFFYAYSVDPESGETLYVQGDFTAVVRIESMEPYETAHEWAKAGIMARVGFEPESPNFMVLRSSKMGVTVQGRDWADAESWHIPMGGDYGQGDHVWLRLDRHGGTFTGSYAVGGETLPETWIGVVSRDVDLPAELLLGLATTSHQQGVPITVDYTDFYMGSYVAPPVVFGPELPPDTPPGGDGYMGIREVIDNGEIPDQFACYASLASGAGTIFDYEAPVLNIHDSDGNGNYGDDDVFGVVTAGHRDLGTVDDISVLVRGVVRIPPSDCPEGCGEWTFGFNSDDGCTLQFPGHDFIAAINGEIANFESGAALRFPGARPAADTLGVINLPPGDHPFWLTYHERGGGAAVELFAAKGAYADFDPDVFHLVGDPGGLQLVGPSDAECFPDCHPDYPEWVAADRPECWCYPWQCHGDADGELGGSEKTGQYHVGPADLSVLIGSWLLKEPPHGLGIASVPNGICADFAHDVGGSEKTGVYRVGPSDLNILIENWLLKEPPHGEGVPPNCLDCP